MIQDALTELYTNLSYITLSGARDFDFNAVSNLTAKIFYLLKAATRLNIPKRENPHYQNAYNINKDRRLFQK